MKRRVLSFIIALSLCLNLCPVWVFAADEGADGGLCPHHPVHTDECGYVPGSPGEPCTFACQICPIEDLIGKLPDSASEYDSEQVQAQLSEIYALYDGLTADEQQQVDLSPCVFLQDQLDGMVAVVQSDGLSDGVSLNQIYILDKSYSYTSPYEVSALTLIDTNGHTFTGSNSSAIRVVGTGGLYLIGTVISEKGAGVEVLSGGFLSITEPGTVVSGMTYALDIASGAEVHLSAGTYTGTNAAIRTAGSDFAALLEPGFAYFDGNGEPIHPADVAGAKTVTVGQCTDHLDKIYTPTPGATEHTWTCQYCGTSETEMCTFTFQNGGGACVCGNSLAIAVDERDLTGLVYDGTTQPENVSIKVTLNGSSELTKGVDYQVDYEPRKDAGEITVTVTGVTFHGTFTKTYTVEQDQPGLSWDTAATPVSVTVDYDGSPVEADDLPPVIINIQSNGDDLKDYLQYSYKNPDDASYTDGLPTNAGTYEVVASLPEMQNFEAAVSDPITLIIRKINPIDTDPAAIQPVFNGSAQALVTAGTLKPAAAQDGAKIQFATSETGPYYTTVPTGTNAGTDYRVWYKVDGGDNYDAVGPTEIEDVEIQRKPVKPIVTLSAYTYQYDNGYKEPTVKVRDEDDLTELQDTEYRVTYTNNKNVGTATVTVSDKDGGNYAIPETQVSFQITLRTQETLSITSKPDTVTYGDKFTLEVSGGSGNGDVTWKIIDGEDVAKVDRDSGQVTIIGDGSATVQATRSGKDPATGVVNYEDATAVWRFSAEKKPVTATVTAKDKPYDNDTEAEILAVVKEGVLPGDAIEIRGLTGEFEDENAGTDKTVTVKTDDAVITGTNSVHYDVSYSSLVVKASIHKAIVHITADPRPAAPEYNGNAQALIGTGAQVDTAGVDVEYALNENGPYSTNFPEVIDAGIYTVWYRVKETDNYTGLSPDSVDVTIGKKTVAPEITLSGNGLILETDGSYSCVYDGAEKTPDVALKESDGSPIPTAEYSVAYSNNTNAGIATVTVTAKDDGNYAFVDVTKNFTIKERKAEVITPPKAAGDPLIFNTRAQELVTEGTGSGGTMVYSTNGTDFTDRIPTETNAGVYTVHYKIEGDPNHTDSDVGSVTVVIDPKPVIVPTIRLFDEDGNPLVSYTYDTTEKKPQVEVKDGTTTIPANEYTVSYRGNINAGTATVIISNADTGNYIVNGTKDFEIAKAAPTVTVRPVGQDLPYNGTAQNLITAGFSPDGTMEYSLDGRSYSTSLPNGTNVGNYNVWYRVTGDPNHNDSIPASVSASIVTNTVNAPVIQVMPESVTYNEKKQEPAVTIYDDYGYVIDGSEYTVAYEDADGNSITNPTNVGKYTLTITGVNGGNYVFEDANNQNTAEFEILPAGQESLTITGTREHVYYGDIILLDTMGGNGSITWGVDSSGIATINGGQLTITGVGPVKVTATSSDPNYITKTATWSFYAERKPVTAVVTAEARTYQDGNKAATVTAALQSGDLVNGDNFTIKLSGSFEDPCAGTDKKVNVDITSPAFIGTGHPENYNITYPTTTTASIFKADIDRTQVTAPTAVANLKYTGSPLFLVSAGSSPEGTMEYSLDGRTYSTSLPTGINADDYDVWYRVTGDPNHNDTVGEKLAAPVTIGKQDVGIPTIEFNPSGVSYDGIVHKPSVTVKDSNSRVIPDSEYTVEYSTATDWKAAGNHTVTITGRGDGNYDITTTTQDFTILRKGQYPLFILNQPSRIQYGDTFTLTAVGGSGTGAVRWESSDEDIATIDGDGVVKILKSGPVTIYAIKEADEGYNEQKVSWTFSAEKKSVTPIVTAKDREYKAGDTSAELVITWKAGDLLDSDNSISLDSILTGRFDNENVGQNKTVWISLTGALPDSDYAITLPETTTASIIPAAASVSGGTTSTLNYTGSSQELISNVTATHGTVVYSWNGIDYTRVVPTEKDAGTYRFWYKALADENYKDSPAVEVTAIIMPKTVNDPQIKLFPETFVYDGAVKKPDVTILDGTIEIPASEYNVSFAGDLTEVNTYVVTVTDKQGGNYEFSGSLTATFDIVRASDTTNPSSPGDTTSPSSPGDTTSPSSPGDTTSPSSPGDTTSPSSPGDTTSPSSPGDTTSPSSPDDTTSPSSPGDTTSPSSPGSTTSPSSPGSTTSPISPSNTTSPSSTTNANSTNSAASASMQTTVQNGTASTVVSAAAGSKLVQAAVASQSESIVIKPEITGEVTKAEVSIPASTVSQIKNETNAALTVSAPIADVTIPNAALDALSSAGGTVSVAAEQVEQSVVLTLTAGGETVESVPGGVTLTVPAEDAGPGTVAVLVHDDGTRETLRKIVVEDGKLSIPLDGSATVEVVDNSKDFTDVLDTDWAAEAVAFASAHELFNGTSETTFSPEQAMSRGMLATVLYSLEGSPELDLEGGFSDVSDEAWYAKGVAWAAENGIAGGYGDGQFGPNDSITREQFVVMLWRYAGSPEAGSQALDFDDADQASSYALEALCWAIENGILSGFGNGLLAPGGTATRAQAAQMLKNFMENT